MRTLLIIPPFIQVNTYFPSVTQLAGYLQFNGYEARSFDLSLSVLLSVFSREGLSDIFAIIGDSSTADPSVTRALSLKDRYIDTIDSVIEYLQGKNTAFAYRLASDHYLPQGDSFADTAHEAEAFGQLGIMDKAKYYCSLYLDDICRLISKTITPHFGFSRYAEKLSLGCHDFQAIESELNRGVNYIESLIEKHTQRIIEEYAPDIAGFTIPFPGNLLGALISARFIKKNYSNIKIVFGGGYINTELRELKDPAIFNYTDYITYDDGELPLLNIVRNTAKTGSAPYTRTLSCENGMLKYSDTSSEHPPHNDLPCPSTEGIEPEKYFSMTEVLNPMHRLWSDGFWNKLTAAHGCYWHKCTFCDTTLDYIGRYSPARAATVVDWMEGLIRSTGRNSFHFTDEAAPPSLLKEIAIEILKRRLSVVWWGNIRFEKAFTSDLCRLLALSGCVAVSGGIEAAEERLLKLIKKGVTLPQAAQVLYNFYSAGILVHTYLMYGFPTETGQEITDSLELVRQMFACGIVKSAYWHRFSLTVHSPVFASPEMYNIKPSGAPDSNPFANNDLAYEDLSGVDYEKYSFGLNKAIYNFMHGIGLDWDVQQWFDFPVPDTRIRKNFIRQSIAQSSSDSNYSGRQRVIWTGSAARISRNPVLVEVETSDAGGYWETDLKTAEWIKMISERAAITSGGEFTYQSLMESFPGDFNKFRDSDIWKELKENLILIV
ncbi:MAG: B12-binding domain-containing radical SAM protein [Bacteroidota bacterium]